MTRNFKLSVLGAALAVPALAAAIASAAGPNMAKNGDFSQGANHWPAYSGVANVTEVTAAGGALEVRIIDGTSAGGYAVAAVQCIKNIQPDTQYQFEADAFIPAGQERSGYANLFAFGYSGPNCDGYTPGAPGTDHLEVTNTWTHLARSFHPPLGTKSVAFHLRIEMHEAIGGDNPDAGFAALFDNASFTNQGPATEPPAFYPQYQGPPPPAAPEVPQGPFDIVIPGPLGGSTPATSTPSNPPSSGTPAPPSTNPTPPAQPQVPPPAVEDGNVSVSFTDGGERMPETSAPLPPDSGSGLALTTTNARTAHLLSAALSLFAVTCIASGSIFWRNAFIRTR